jgi:arylsulfatase A-like enzyme
MNRQQRSNTAIPGSTRRKFLAGALASPLVRAAAAEERPNVLVIVMDDLGCQDLGYLGAADLKTPNIDSLAERGLKFRNWYSNAPVCAPARSAILTGRSPVLAGVPNNGSSLAHDVPTIASVVRSAGYRTACIGKWHLGDTDETAPTGHGFDYFYGFHSGCVDYFSHRYYWGEPQVPNYHDLWRNRTEIFEDGRYLTERITEEAAGYIERNRANPFFAYIAYNAPHYPMHAPDKYKARLPGLEPERQTYGAMIAAVDDGVGQIRHALETAGIAENTLIFLLGDNGATVEKRAGLNGKFATAGSNGRFKGFKFSLFDGGMHVPGLVSWPARIRRGGWTDELAMSMDILPSICRATGASVPPRVNGSDILDTIVNGEPSPHKSLYWSQGVQLATRRGPWKLVVNGRLFDRRADDKPLEGEDAIWLSNLDEDPGETRNLRRQHASLVDELLTDLYRWRDGLRKPE